MSAGMEETSCSRKEVLQELVGDVSNFFVTEGPFGRIRARNKNTVCEYWTPSTGPGGLMWRRHDAEGGASSL